MLGVSCKLVTHRPQAGEGGLLPTTFVADMQLMHLYGVAEIQITALSNTAMHARKSTTQKHPFCSSTPCTVHERTLTGPLPSEPGIAASGNYYDSIAATRSSQQRTFLL